MYSTIRLMCHLCISLSRAWMQISFSLIESVQRATCVCVCVSDASLCSHHPSLTPNHLTTRPSCGQRMHDPPRPGHSGKGVWVGGGNRPRGLLHQMHVRFEVFVRGVQGTHLLPEGPAHNDPHQRYVCTCRRHTRGVDTRFRCPTLV